MSSEVKVAVVGVGYWGPNLLRVFDAQPDARVTLVCDRDAARLASLGHEYRGLETTTRLDDVLRHPDVDAVVVAVPASEHHAVGSAVLMAGKHCLIEKPLATTEKECRELIDLAESRGRTLMVGHTFEYNVAVQKVKELIDTGDVGEIYHILSQRLNLGRVRDDVDALWNLAPHDVSITLYWLGGRRPHTVRAQGFSHLGRPNLADTGTLTLEFDDGAAAQILVSWLSPEKIRKMMVVGSKKMIVYDDVSVDAKVQVYDKGVDVAAREGWAEHESYGEFQLRVRSGDLFIPNIRHLEPLRLEAAEFLRAVRTGARPQSDGESGLRVTQVLEAATRSMARDGAPVRIAEG